MSKVDVYGRKGNATWLNFVIGSFVSIIVSLVLILFFALFIKWFNWSDGIITPANIVIKIISMAIGVLFVCSDGEKGAVKGAILGMIYIFFCFVVFSILNGAMNFNMSLVYDLFLGFIGGGILGVIVVNIKK